MQKKRKKECTGTKITEAQSWITEHLINWMDTNPLQWPLGVSPWSKSLLQGGESFKPLLCSGPICPLGRTALPSCKLLNPLLQTAWLLNVNCIGAEQARPPLQKPFSGCCIIRRGWCVMYLHLWLSIIRSGHFLVRNPLLGSKGRAPL